MTSLQLNAICNFIININTDSASILRKPAHCCKAEMITHLFKIPDSINAQ